MCYNVPVGGLEHMNRTNQELEMKVVQLYQDGLNVLQVAQELGLGQGTAYRILQRNGITLRNPNFAETPEIIETIRQMCNQGIGIREIAKRFNVSTSPIQRIMQENGIESSFGIGEKHQSWKGGRRIDSKGYVLVWVDPQDPMAVMAIADNMVREHRLVMAREIGRPLKPYETVHHINGDRTDNRIENLQLRKGNHGNGQVYCCADCGSRNIIQCEIE
jgi:transposase-like protein